MAKKSRPKEIQKYWDYLSNEIGCVISGQTPATIHHCHGGSMLERGVHTGMAQKTSDWLVIPLAAEYHTGQFGIDNGMGKYKGVREWEKAFGEQSDFIDYLIIRSKINVWQKAGVWLWKEENEQSSN